MRRFNLATLATHAVLLIWSAVVLFPLWTMLINSIKPKREIFRDPYGLPSTVTFDGYRSAWTDGRFDLYFRNSITVTVLSLVLILVLGSLAAYAIASWRSRFSNFVYLAFVAGLMIPIRLGTINIFQTILALGLNDTIWGLIPVYVAMGLPIATFVLVPFIRALPGDLVDAARVDGAAELRIYASVIMPMIRPALATVLIFIRQQEARTVIYGVSLLFGQYQTDWTRILSALSLSAVPLLILYLLMSKQFIKGLTAGAVKG